MSPALPLLVLLSACGAEAPSGTARVGAAPGPEGVRLHTDDASLSIGMARLGGSPLGAGPWAPAPCEAWPGERCRRRVSAAGASELRHVPRGLALAWRLDRPGDGPLEIPWSGIAWQQAGDGLRGEDASGRVWWHGPAVAWDAHGEAVAAAVRPAAGGVAIDLDLAGAAFPVTVDPIVQTAEWTWSGALEGVHDAGDLDGDGYDELVVFSRGGTTTSVGEAIVVPGSAAGPDSAGAVYLSAPGATWEFGRAAAAAGDVNGDGYGDLIVGGGGTAWVWLGAATGVAAAPDLTLPGPSGATATGFGFAVSRAGDVHGDGYDDVLVGDPTTDGQTGSVWLFAGSAAGTETTPEARWDGVAPVDWFGISVAPAGDVDADGYDDVVIGAANAAAITGYAKVFHGSADGLAAAATTTIRGAGAGSTLGRSVDAAGDIDGDGYDDVVIGIPGERAAHGAVALHHGSATGVETAARTTIDGGALGAKLGTSVSGAGDTDGDGYPDIVGGSPATTASVTVWAGGAAGLSTAETPRIEGGMTLGKWVDGGMDVDGDGIDDVVVSDPGARVAGWHPGGPDADGDGFPAREDCDDTDASVGAAEWWWPDRDGDGWGDDAGGRETCAPDPGDVASGGDCDDGDAGVSPDAAEVDGDGVDGDCDGLEACHFDVDGDGARTATLDDPGDDVRCEAPGHATAGAPIDCDDTDPTISPSAAETCDGRDEDCDGRVDEPVPADAPAWFPDADGDGHGAGAPVAACAPPSGHVAADGDCDDADPLTHPGAPEVAGDGVDQDCDGADAAAEPPDTGDPPEATEDDPDKPGAPRGCASAPTPTGALALALALTWGRRRRRVLHRRR